MWTQSLQAFLLCLLAPTAALAQASEGTRGGPIWYFWLAVMVAIIVAWFIRVMSKRRQPPIDPRQHRR